jgi:hypothetical protein
MKNREKANVVNEINKLEGLIVQFRKDLVDNKVTNESAINSCNLAFSLQLSYIRGLFEQDLKSPYEENVDVYYQGVLWTIKDYDGDILAIKKGNDIKIVKSHEVSLTAPVPAPVVKPDKP